MKKQTLFPLAVLLITLLALPSCRKAITLAGGEHRLQELLDSACRIETVSVTDFNGMPDQYQVYYNAAGNPDSMIDNNPHGSIGNPRYFFRYDSLNRLSDFMWTQQPYTSEGGYFAIYWHKYAYPQTDLVIDTSIEYAGDVRGPRPLAFSNLTSVRSYGLDAQGRIEKIYVIADVNDTIHAPVLVSTITYDANGNLPLSDPARTYDNKINFFQTNKVWQFVFMNYSRNNVISTDTTFVPVYNGYGLPLHLQNLNYGPSPFGLIWNTGLSLDITYSCSAPQGPINY